MKSALFMMAVYALIIGSNANSYQNGLITGVVVNKLAPNNKKPIKYNAVILDTSLVEFPQQKAPVCKPIDVRQVTYYKIKLIHIYISIIFAVVACLIVIPQCLRDEEYCEFMVGYLMGMFLEGLMRDDD